MGLNMITKFDKYREQSDLCNESVRDQMTPKSRQDIYDSIEKFPKWQRWSKVKELGLQDIYLDIEIQEMIEDAEEDYFKKHP